MTSEDIKHQFIIIIIIIISVQLKVVSVRSEKPICAPTSLSEVFPTLSLKINTWLPPPPPHPPPPTVLTPPSPPPPLSPSWGCSRRWAVPLSFCPRRSCARTTRRPAPRCARRACGSWSARPPRARPWRPRAGSTSGARPRPSSCRRCPPPRRPSPGTGRRRHACCWWGLRQKRITSYCHLSAKRLLADSFRRPMP